MKQPPPQFESLVPRILSGEITRQQAADIACQETGYSRSTFLVWLNTSGNAAKLKGVRGSSGPRNIHSHAQNDPNKVKAYEDAVKTVLAGQTGTYAAEKHGVNYQYLMKLINKRKLQEQKHIREQSAAEYLQKLVENPLKAEKLALLAKVAGL